MACLAFASVLVTATWFGADVSGNESVAREAILLKAWVPCALVLWGSGSRLLWAAKRHDLSQTFAVLGGFGLGLSLLILFRLVDAPAVGAAALLALLNVAAWGAVWLLYRSAWAAV